MLACVRLAFNMPLPREWCPPPLGASHPVSINVIKTNAHRPFQVTLHKVKLTVKTNRFNLCVTDKSRSCPKEQKQQPNPHLQWFSKPQAPQRKPPVRPSCETEERNPNVIQHRSRGDLPVLPLLLNLSPELCCPTFLC